MMNVGNNGRRTEEDDEEKGFRIPAMPEDTKTLWHLIDDSRYNGFHKGWLYHLTLIKFALKI